jgi:hypothetical protein
MAIMSPVSQSSREGAVDIVKKAIASLPRSAWIPTADAWDARSREASRNRDYFDKQAMFSSRDYAESLIPVYNIASLMLRALHDDDQHIYTIYPELK